MVFCLIHFHKISFYRDQFGNLEFDEKQAAICLGNIFNFKSRDRLAYAYSIKCCDSTRFDECHITSLTSPDLTSIAYRKLKLQRRYCM